MSARLYLLFSCLLAPDNSAASSNLGTPSSVSSGPEAAHSSYSALSFADDEEEEASLLQIQSPAPLPHVPTLPPMEDLQTAIDSARLSNILELPRDKATKKKKSEELMELHRLLRDRLSSRTSQSAQIRDVRPPAPMVFSRPWTTQDLVALPPSLEAAQHYSPQSRFASVRQPVWTGDAAFNHQARPAAFFERANGSADAGAGGFETAAVYELANIGGIGDEFSQLPWWAIALIVIFSTVCCCVSFCYFVCKVDEPDEREFWYNACLVIFVPGTFCDIQAHDIVKTESLKDKLAQHSNKQSERKLDRAKRKGNKEQREQIEQKIKEQEEAEADLSTKYIRLWCLPPIPCAPKKTGCWHATCDCYYGDFRPRMCMVNYAILAFIAGGTAILWKAGVLQPVLNEMLTYLFIMVSLILIIAVLAIEIGSIMHAHFVGPIQEVVENIDEGLQPVEDAMHKIHTKFDKLAESPAVARAMGLLGMQDDEVDDEGNPAAPKKKTGCC